jgi:FkbM family methyltransferase
MIIHIYAKFIYFTFIFLIRSAYKRPNSTTFSAQKHNNMAKLSNLANKVFNILVGIVSKKVRNDYTMMINYEECNLLIRPFTFSDIVMASGLGEPYVKTILDKEVRNDDVVVDIGANMGIYTIPLAKRTSKVIAFEPHPKSAEMLEKSMRLNQLRNVVLIKKPVGDSKKKVLFDLRLDPVHSRIDITETFEPGTALATEKVETESIDLDTALAMESKINWLLIDVNGFELNLLNGARNILRRHSPRIIIEPKYYNVDKVNEILIKEGYTTTNIWSIYYYAVKNNNLNMSKPARLDKR